MTPQISPTGDDLQPRRAVGTLRSYSRRTACTNYPQKFALVETEPFSVEAEPTKVADIYLAIFIGEKNVGYSTRLGTFVR
jgi:hypothetical protein